jgi:DNA-binding LacI/PurR family transcriptional regulator
LEDGFTNEARTHGVPLGDLRIFTCDNIYADNGYRLADQLVQEHAHLPRAFFCVEDHLVLGMIQRFREAGLKVPADVAFIGFGDLMNPKHYPHDVTSVRQPAREKGKKAGELLLHILNHPQEMQKIQTIILDPPLTIRKTCGCK